jgi:uncharacterized protein (TIGR00369 family)
VPVDNVGTCFACGKKNPHGLQLDVRKTPDGVEFEYEPPEKFEGWQGIVHGGIVATMLDELCAWACTARGFDAVTGELSVRYRRPMRVGGRVRGLGRMLTERGRFLLAESRLLDENGNTIAEARGKMMKA